MIAHDWEDHITAIQGFDRGLELNKSGKQQCNSGISEGQKICNLGPHLFFLTSFLGFFSCTGFALMAAWAFLYISST